MSKFRKALMAAAGAAVAALASAYAQDGLTDWKRALGMAFVAAITVGAATYGVPNAQPTLTQYNRSK